jgi:hypothetical protein
VSTPVIASTPMHQPTRELSAVRAERLWQSLRQVIESPLPLSDGTLTELVRHAEAMRLQVAPARLEQIDAEKLARVRG